MTEKQGEFSLKEVVGSLMLGLLLILFMIIIGFCLVFHSLDKIEKRCVQEVNDGTK